MDECYQLYGPECSHAQFLHIQLGEVGLYIVAFAQLLFQWLSGGHDFHSLLLLMSLPVGDMAELEKVFFCKAHNYWHLLTC